MCNKLYLFYQKDERYKKWVRLYAGVTYLLIGIQDLYSCNYKIHTSFFIDLKLNKRKIQKVSLSYTLL